MKNWIIDGDDHKGDLFTAIDTPGNEILSTVLEEMINDHCLIIAYQANTLNYYSVGILGSLYFDVSTPQKCDGYCL